MRRLQVYLVAGLATAKLPLPALAKECETASAPDPGTGEKILRVSSPDQLAVFEGCSSLTGHIVINYDYSGDFILNGITEVYGNITTGAPADDLGVVEMLDLLDVGNIWLVALRSDVNLPKLQRAGSIDLVQTSPSGEVDLGELVEADNVRIWGSWTSINLQSLETVTDEASFCGSHDCGIYPDDEFPHLDIDLPSITKANRFEVAGTIKSVSVPQLEVVGYQDPDPWSSKGLMIQSLRINIQEGEYSLSFDAPKLRTLNGLLEVYGAVSSLSLGALGDTNAGATFIASSPLSVYSTIKTAKYFYVWGELFSIDLPNFTDLGTVDLAYEPRMPCNETLYRLWESTPGGSYGQGLGSRCIRPNGPEEGGEAGEEAPNNDDEPDGVPVAEDAESDGSSLENSDSGETYQIGNEETSSGDTVDDATSNPSTSDRGTNGEVNTTGAGDSNNGANGNTPETGTQDTSGFNASNATGENSAASPRMFSIYCSGLMMLAMATAGGLPAFL